MACNCMRRTAADYDRARKEAFKLSELENTDYVIYEFEGKTYTDRKICWEKAGRPGIIRELVCRL